MCLCSSSAYHFILPSVLLVSYSSSYPLFVSSSPSYHNEPCLYIRLLLTTYAFSYTPFIIFYLSSFASSSSPSYHNEPRVCVLFLTTLSFLLCPLQNILHFLYFFSSSYHNHLYRCVSRESSRWLCFFLSFLYHYVS